MRGLKAARFSALVILLLSKKAQVLAEAPVEVTTVITESGWIGINTAEWTASAHIGTTKWIGKNTQYITDVEQTKTISGAPAVVTSYPVIQIIGPVDGAGVPTGAFDFIMAPALVAQIQALSESLCHTNGGSRTCSADYIPRLQSLLKGGGNVLTERTYVEADLGAAVLGMISYSINETYVEEGSVGALYHVDNFTNKPSFAPVLSLYTVTRTGIPKATQVIGVTTPAITGGDNDDSCWKYVGIEVELSEEDRADIDNTVPDPTVGISVRKRSSNPAENFNNTGISYGNNRRLRRHLTERFNLHELNSHQIFKRAVRKVINIGQCAPAKPTSLIIRALPHPRPIEVMQPFDIRESSAEFGLDPALWWFVPEQTPTDTGNPCVIATLTKKGRRDPSSTTIGVANFPLPYDQLTSLTNLNVDHIYESSTIQDFFDSELKNPTDNRCASFIAMFDKPNQRLGTSISRFYSLWELNSNRLPNNWAFAGVDERVNNFKGTLLNPGLDGWPNPARLAADYDLLFQTWNNAGLSMQFINNAAMKSYYSKRNLAVYKAFLDFDQIQQCEKDPNDISESTSWAAAYKNYMLSLLRDNQVLLRQKVQSLSTAIAAQPDKLYRNGKKTAYGKAFDALSAIFPPGSFTYDSDAMLKFSTGSAGIRRDVDPPYVCVKPAPPTPCVERIIVDCTYQYINRPTVSPASCPPIPVLPASCTGGLPQPTIAPVKPPAPVLVLPGYCIPVDDSRICTLATSFRKGEDSQSNLMGSNAFLYDNKCNEFQNYAGIKAGTSIGSKLPFTVEIQRWDTGIQGPDGTRLLTLQFAYEAQVKYSDKDRKDDCYVTNHSIPPSEHHVLRCPFDCSETSIVR